MFLCNAIVRNFRFVPDVIIFRGEVVLKSEGKWLITLSTSQRTSIRV